MQDRTPPSDNPTWGINPEIAAAEDLMAAGMPTSPSADKLGDVVRDAMNAGTDWVLYTPGTSMVESAQTLPGRVAAGIRWLLANPIAGIEETDDTPKFVAEIAYHMGVQQTVDMFMKVPKIQREVAKLFAPGQVPAPRSGESSS
jgi:hypothetical protein